MSDPACAARVIAQLAARYPQPFDAAALVEEKCGRFQRGKHKGQLRGWAALEVVSIGGWKRTGPGEGNGHVLYPGTVVSITISDFAGKIYLSV